MIRTLLDSHNTPTEASLTLVDSAGHRVEVVAELCDCRCPEGHVTLRVIDSPPVRSACAEAWPDPEFAARPEPLFAFSLAPDWGLSCPYCGYRNHVQDFGEAPGQRCAGCHMFYRVPAGALSVTEARRRPTEAGSGRKERQHDGKIYPRGECEV